MNKEMIAILRKAFDNREINLAKMVAAPKSALVQLELIQILNDCVSARGGEMSVLATQIMHQQKNRVTEWGVKAYKLSEKQVDVFVRDYEPHRGQPKIA